MIWASIAHFVASVLKQMLLLLTKFYATQMQVYMNVYTLTIFAHAMQCRPTGCTQDIEVGDYKFTVVEVEVRIT